MLDKKKSPSGQGTSLTVEQNKTNNKPTQLKTIFQYLKENVATASMVSDATGIYQKNICRFKRDLEKLGLLQEIEKKYCEKTGFMAWYLTTDESKFPVKNLQLKLF